MNRERVTNPNKKYKELKQKQKARVSDIMYQETDRFLQEKKHIPNNKESIQIAEIVYRRVQGLGFWIPYEEVLNEYQKKSPHMLQRLKESGLPQHLLPKTIPSTATGNTSKSKMHKSGRRKKKPKELSLPEQDDTFFFIAGYTSGGAPYGVTWEEMGLEPWEKIE